MTRGSHTSFAEFKRCPSCSRSWKSRQDFLVDYELQLIGYQANFIDISQGLFLFNHLSCKTTLSLKTGLFADLYKGNIYAESKFYTDYCLGYCLKLNDLSSCPVECRHAFVREIIQIIKNHKPK